MLRNGERGAGGYDEGLMNALREVERNMDGGQQMQSGSAGGMYFHKNANTLSQFCPLVL